jgi:hypothetical protein
MDAQVLIGGTGNPADEPVDGALLELRSADQGLLIPRVALTAANSAAPLTGKVAGMVVYNTGTGGLAETGVYYNDGVNWVKIGSGALNAVATANGTGTTVSGTGSSASPLKVDIAAGGVGQTQLANDAVTSAKIADGAIVTADLADNSVTSAKIVNGTIQAVDLSSMGATSNMSLRWNGSAWEAGYTHQMWVHRIDGYQTVSMLTIPDINCTQASACHVTENLIAQCADGELRVWRPDGLIIKAELFHVVCTQAYGSYQLDTLNN